MLSVSGKPIDIVRDSKSYQILTRLREWASGSTTLRLLNDERVLAGLLGVFVLFSLIRILASDLHTTVKFLSFALMFVVLAALTWDYTEPVPDE
jgi:hypothetical protein